MLRVNRSARGPSAKAAAHQGGQAEEIATGVYRLQTGGPLSGSNVYLVRSGPSFVLIDAAWPNRGQLIKQVAEQLFGAGARPVAILLTHLHPDHAGSAAELARMWNVPVYVHPDEMPLAPGKYLPEYANPLDRWVIGPLTRVLPARALESSMENIATAFDPRAGVPGLPDWRCVPTPGHTPGHVAFFRDTDRVLITGDAVLTVNLNSLRDFVLSKHTIAGPPYISTWDWPTAAQSVAALARLEPQVLAPGHGAPMTTAAAGLRAFSASLSARARRKRPRQRAEALSHDSQWDRQA
jgi:glyoxylase-like metal-dependent hydrolase (beta-lactamase superfamily II)